MKRGTTRQPTPGNSPPAANGWHGTLSATACAWRDLETSKTSIALLVASGFAMFTIVVIAPFYFLGLGLVSLVAFFKGLNPDPSPVLSDPMFWVSLVGSGAVAGLLILLLALKRTVVAFTFDSETEQFEYIEKRLFFQPITKRVPFESIVEIVPTLLTTYATAGHFHVTTHLPGGHTRSLWLGNDIPLATLIKHNEWLSAHLGKRVRPVSCLDC